MSDPSTFLTIVCVIVGTIFLYLVVSSALPTAAEQEATKANDEVFLDEYQKSKKLLNQSWEEFQASLARQEKEMEVEREIGIPQLQEAYWHAKDDTDPNFIRMMQKRDPF